MVLIFPLSSDTGEHGSFLLFHSLFLSLKLSSHFHIHQIEEWFLITKLHYNKLIEEFKLNIGAQRYLSLWKYQFMQQDYSSQWHEDTFCNCKNDVFGTFRKKRPSSFCSPINHSGLSFSVVTLINALYLHCHLWFQNTFSCTLSNLIFIIFPWERE